MKKTKKGKRAARLEPKAMRLVPKVVFRTAFAGVVPVCVAAASSCGGRVQGNANSTVNGVGMAAFTQTATQTSTDFFTVGTSAFTQTATTTSTETLTNFVGVACICFAPPDSSVDSAADGGPDDDAPEGSFIDSSTDGSSDANEESEASFGDAGLDAPEGD